MFAWNVLECLFCRLRYAQFCPADARMAVPTGQMNNNFVLTRRHFSSVANDISADKSSKMEHKRPTLDPSNANRSGKSFC